MYSDVILHANVALAVVLGVVSAFAEMTSIVFVNGTSKFVDGMTSL